MNGELQNSKSSHKHIHPILLSVTQNNGYDRNLSGVAWNKPCFALRLLMPQWNFLARRISTIHGFDFWILPWIKECRPFQVARNGTPEGECEKWIWARSTNVVYMYIYMEKLSKIRKIKYKNERKQLRNLAMISTSLEHSPWTDLISK